MYYILQFPYVFVLFVLFNKYFMLFVSLLSAVFLIFFY